MDEKEGQARVSNEPDGANEMQTDPEQTHNSKHLKQELKQQSGGKARRSYLKM